MDSGTEGEGCGRRDFTLRAFKALGSLPSAAVN